MSVRGRRSLVLLVAAIGCVFTSRPILPDSPDNAARGTYPDAASDAVAGLGDTASGADAPPVFDTGTMRPDVASPPAPCDDGTGAASDGGSADARGRDASPEVGSGDGAVEAGRACDASEAGPADAPGDAARNDPDADTGDAVARE